MVGQAVGMGRAFCVGPRQSVPGKLAASPVSVLPGWAHIPTVGTFPLSLM